LLLIELGITRLDVERKSLILTFSQDKTMDSERLVQFINSQPGRFRFLSQYKLKINIDRLSSLEDFPEIEKAIKSVEVESEG
ncbi:MAG: hypothetical protein KAV87_15865, partial [Desulfobacteraceae bacterium]|nr:hypothetical protein [Desulfobacteraceae bacterium]